METQNIIEQARCKTEHALKKGLKLLYSSKFFLIFIKHYEFLIGSHMKQPTTVTVEEELLARVKAKLQDGTFRSQSHLFEFVVQKLLEEK
jgi:hypothetical protein